MENRFTCNYHQKNRWHVCYMRKYLFILFLLLFSISSHAGVTYLHVDLASNVIAEPNASGAVVVRFYYEPFGKQIGTQNNNQPGYASHFYDAGLGLVYMQARYYDPLMGRFYSDDPAAFNNSNTLSFNRYIYANNNPYKYKDPDGKIPILIPVAIFIAKEVAAEIASNATGGATDFLSLRRMGAKGGKFAANKLSAAISRATGDAKQGVAKSAGKASDKAPDFIVSQGGTAFPVPKGATGPTPVVNPGGKTTGSAFTGGSGGANGKVDTMRIMDSTTFTW